LGVPPWVMSALPTAPKVVQNKWAYVRGEALGTQVGEGDGEVVASDGEVRSDAQAPLIRLHRSPALHGIPRPNHTHPPTPTASAQR